MDKVKYKFQLISDIIEGSVISNGSLLIDSHFVYTNPAKIESVEVIKVNSEIKKIKSAKIYELKSHRIIVKQNNEKENIIISDEMDTNTIISNKCIKTVISDNINSCFIKSLKSSNIVKSVKYFNRGFLKKIFNKRDYDIIISEIIHHSWIFTSKKIAEELSKSGRFIPIGEKKNGFLWFGNIDNTPIYVSNSIDYNEIYAGNLNSISAIINKNAEIETFNSGNFYEEGLKITIEYLFINNGVKKIIVE